jgi:hypothetical protein
MINWHDLSTQIAAAIIAAAILGGAGWLWTKRDHIGDRLSAHPWSISVLASFCTAAVVSGIVWALLPIAVPGLPGRDGKDGQNGKDAIAPPQMVAFFDLSDCPGGWSRTNWDGLYIVAVRRGVRTGDTIGMPLENKENRATGAHTHLYEQATGTINELISRGAGETSAVSFPLGYSRKETTNVNYSGVKNGTNAPYVQLSECKKDLN